MRRSFYVFIGLACAASASRAEEIGSFDPYAPPVTVFGDGSSSAVVRPTVAPVPSDQDVDDGEALANAAADDGAPLDETVVDEVAADDGWAPDAYSDFQQALAPYGSWVDDPTYGQIWYPSTQYVGADFSPYVSGGYWAFTEYGWTWVSDWAWGWAPFHYGRWFWYGSYGWCWRPGRVWGPGWVSWRSGGGYTGWAPLPPRGSRYVPPPTGRSAWSFVRSHQLGGRPSVLPRSQFRQVFRSTRFHSSAGTFGGVKWNMGPSPHQIGARVGTTQFRSLPAQITWPRASVGAPLRTSHPLGLSGTPARPGWTPSPGSRPGYAAPLAPTTPRPSYGAPMGARPGFAPSYPRPMNAPSYGRPSFTPSSPRPSYAPPARSWGGSSGFSPPSRSFSPPSRSFSPPSHSFSPPSRSFSPPSRSFSAPAFRGGGFRGGGRR